MDPRLPDRIEELLTRAFDGEATPSERAELAELVDCEPRLREMAELRAALQAALAAPGPVDVAADVMAVLEGEATWAPLGESLRAAFPAPEVDFASAIMGEIADEAAWASVRESLLDAVLADDPPAVDVADGVLAAIAEDAAFADIGESLRDALTAPMDVAPPVDVAEGVMAFLSQEADFAPVGDSLRAAIAGAPAVDVADAVLASIDPEAELSAYFDGELPAERMAVVAARLLDDAQARDTLTAYAALGGGLRDATHRGGDVWPAIAEAIGAEADAVHGWDEVAAPLREAFAALPRIDVATAVMAAVEPRMPRWASLAAPVIGMLAAAAAALFFVLVPHGGDTQPPLTGSVAALRLGEHNDAQVEEISAPADTVVQVMQFEDGGPTFILIDDSSGVPL